MPPFLIPLSRALSQFDDRVFLGVIARSIGWSILCFFLLHLLAARVVADLVPDEGPIGWAAQIAASFGVTVLAMWLFVPVAAAIAALYVERVAAAVDDRYYPSLPPAPGAPVLGQVIEALVLGLRLLGLVLLGLLTALLIPGIGLLIAWGITSYAIGRGFFLPVAMRRMPRRQAEAVYRAHRGRILAQGGLIALGVWLPVVNLIAPVIGMAAMVHVLDQIMTGPRNRVPLDRPGHG